MLIVLYIKPFD